MHWLLVLLVIGATFRLTRLVTTDRVTLRVREAIWTRDVDRGKVDEEGKADGALSYLVDCPWCVSMYLAWPPAVAAVWWPENRGVWLVLAALTASAATGLLAQVERD